MWNNKTEAETYKDFILENFCGGIEIITNRNYPAKDTYNEIQYMYDVIKKQLQENPCGSYKITFNKNRFAMEKNTEKR